MTTDTLTRAAELLEVAAHIMWSGAASAQANDTAARLREMAKRAPHDGEIYTDNSAVIANAEARIAELEAALHRARLALQEPASEWKSHCERQALDQIQRVLPCPEESR